MELTLEILDEVISKIKEYESKSYEVAFVNSGDWRKCIEATRFLAQANFTGEWLWGMRVIAIPEIPEDTMILYNSPDNYKIVKHIRKEQDGK